MSDVVNALELAENACRLGEYQPAVKTLLGQMDLAPKDSVVFSSLSIVLAGMGRTAAAAKSRAHAEALGQQTEAAQIALIKAHIALAGASGVSDEQLTQAENFLQDQSSVALTAQFAHLLWHAGQYERAFQKIKTIQSCDVDDAEAGFILARVAGAIDDWQAAFDYLSAGLKCDAVVALGKTIAHCSEILQEAIIGRESDMISLLERLNVTQPDISYALGDVTRAEIVRLKQRQQDLIERGVPSCALATMGKSGSATVGQILADGFQLVGRLYSLGDRTVVPRWAREFAEGGSFYNTHLQATEQNVETLRESGLSRILVHVRDPRQAILSVVHWSEHHVKHTRLMREHRLADMDIEAKIDFGMEHYWGYFISWIENWLAASATLDVRFTTFEQMRMDFPAFLEALLNNYGADRSLFDSTRALSIHTDRDYRFRNGEIDEWRRVFTRKQIELVNDQLPRDMAKFFGWQI